MRTEFKIGIAVGLLMVIILAVWMIVADSNEPADTGSTDEATAPPRVVIGQTPPERPQPPVDEPDTPPAADGGTIDPGPIIFPELEGVDVSVDAPATPDTEPPEAPATPRGSETVSIDVEPLTLPPANSSMPQLDTPAALRTEPTVPSTPAAGTSNYLTTATRSYVVRPGDNGFWSVSQKMYGNGKYMNVIAEANPSVDPETLRAGQRLVVPPLPEKYRQPAAGRPGAEPARQPDILSGERVYVVKKGDAGFWGVSVAVYGHGKYYREIQKANPTVDSDRLREGMKLIVPPTPRENASAGSATTTIQPQLPAGWRTYTVVSGDAGFWDVAVKMYNNGRLYGAIAKANPTVNSRRMQPGQRLRVPPLAEAKRLMGASDGPVRVEPAAPAPATSVDPGRPDFR